MKLVWDAYKQLCMFEMRRLQNYATENVMNLLNLKLGDFSIVEIPDYLVLQIQTSGLFDISKNERIRVTKFGFKKAAKQ